jgi:hypothetical protein
MGRSGIRFAFVAAALAAAAAFAEDASKAAIREMEADVAAMRAIRDGLVARVRARPTPATTPIVLTLEFPRLLRTDESWQSVTATLVTKAKVSHQEHMDRLRALDPPVWNSNLPGPPFGEIQLEGDAIPAGSKAYLVGAFSAQVGGPVRWEAPGPGTRSWIAGREVAHGQAVVVPEGGLSVVVETSSAAGADLRRLRPCFWPSRGEDADLKTWRAELARRRPYLERAMAVSKDPALRARIEALLQRP